jgi:hypothetical protein
MPCSDPALAIYILQQVVEKVMKALAIASGKYSYHQIIGFNHNSLALFADFYLKFIETTRTNNVASLFVAFGLNIDDEEKKLRELHEKAIEKYSNYGEIPYIKQFATLPTEQIDKMIDLIDITKHKIILKTVNEVWGSQNEITINVEEIHVDTTEAFADSIFKTVGSKLNMPITKDSKNAIMAYLEVLKNVGIKPSKEGITEKSIRISRNTESYTSMLAMLALLNLASLTFPHQNSCRYPKEPSNVTTQEQNTGLGCEDYIYSLGIVNRLARLGHVTEQMLVEIKPQLENVSDFFKIISSSTASLPPH